MKYQIVLLLCLLLISSCGQTTKKVTSDFESAEEATGIEIMQDDTELEVRETDDTVNTREEIEKKFNNYNLQFNPRILLNWYVITNTTQETMKEDREEIKALVTEALEQNALGEESYVIDSCLKEMETYEKYIALVAEEYDFSDELNGREITLSDYVYAYEYNDAHAMLVKVRESMLKIIENLNERKKMNIEELPKEYIGAWEAYYDAYEEYDEYIELWHDKSYILAEEMHEDISKAFGDANMVREQRPMTQMVNSVELWYEQNIGVCVE